MREKTAVESGSTRAWLKASIPLCSLSINPLIIDGQRHLSEELSRALVYFSPIGYPNHCTARETSEPGEYSRGIQGFDSTGSLITITTCIARYYVSITIHSGRKHKGRSNLKMKTKRS